MNKNDNSRPTMPKALVAFGILVLAFLLSFIMAQPFSLSIATLLSSNDRSDYSVTDYYNAVANSRNKRFLDSTIVIVNIDTLDASRRDDIAQLIEVVNAFEPKAIGLDVVFERPHEDDSQLLSAIDNCSNIIMASELNQIDGTYTFTPRKDSFFRPAFPSKSYGAINIPSKYEKSVVRNFPTSFTMADGTQCLSFVSAIAQATDTAAFNTLMARGNQFEIINFPSVEFDVIEPGEVFANRDKIKDKIVLIGTVHDSGDSHITPISAHMAGVIIHAHALRTVLNQSYLRTLPTWLNWFFAGILGYIMIVICLYIPLKIKGLIMRIVQISLLLLILPIGYYFFLHHSLVIEVAYLLLMVGFTLFAVDIWVGLTNLPEYIKKAKTKHKS